MFGQSGEGAALGAATSKWFDQHDARGVFVTDERFIVRCWNRWLATQTGKSGHDIVGRSLFEVFPDLVVRGLDASYHAALLGETRLLSQRLHNWLLPVTRTFYGAGTTEMLQSTRIEPLSNGRAIIGTITVIEDVTERVIAERELRSQIAASDHARQIAEQASQLKDEFLATLSHEIRTPLNAVIGWTKILQTQPALASREHALDVIERNALSQLRLVDDLLDIARIISGKFRLKIDTVSLVDVTKAAVDVVAPGASAKGITIETSFASLVSPVRGDGERLQQVVWNLLSNAVKFTEAGGRIRIEIGAVGPLVRLSVRDSGRGVAADFLPFVFDRFRQADGSASRRHGGLGLGLSLVRQIVELHGGTVGVESGGANQGANFWITIPAASAVPTGSEGPATVEPVTLEGVRILAVEDEVDARDLLLAMLTDFGATVRAAASAEEALAILRADTWTPDVLISDVGMADTDGFALIRAIRAFSSQRIRSLPAIAVTAYANPQDRVRALVAGYQNHVPKPVDAQVLATAIAELVRVNKKEHAIAERKAVHLDDADR